MLDYGHDRLTVIGGPTTLWTARERLAGYREAFAAAGLDPDGVRVLEGDYQQESGRVLAEEALSADPRPTALICANDLMAIGAIEYCRSSGLRVPEDVSIVGFDDLPTSRLLSPGLTSVWQPALEMGMEAARALLELLDTGMVGAVDTFSATVQIRGSVAAPGGTL